MCELALPNKEICLVYRKEVLQKLEHIIPQSSVNSIQKAIYFADSNMLKTCLEALLLQSASYFDTANESFYHGFLLGLCAVLNTYKCSSNKESREGRFDIQLKPIVKDIPGIIIEIKAAKNSSKEELEDLATRCCLLREKCCCCK